MPGLNDGACLMMLPNAENDRHACNGEVAVYYIIHGCYPSREETANLTALTQSTSSALTVPSPRPLR